MPKSLDGTYEDRVIEPLGGGTSFNGVGSSWSFSGGHVRGSGTPVHVTRESGMLVGQDVCKGEERITEGLYGRMVLTGLYKKNLHIKFRGRVQLI